MKRERILVVDDEPLVCEMISKALYHMDCDIISAVNGKQALDLLRKEAADILITDLEMPEMDGMQLARTVRDEFPALSLVFLVSADSGEIRSQLINLGAIDYISKPITPDDIRARLTRIIRERNRTGELAQKATELEMANEELRHLDQLKANFVSSVSEELQTPITIIQEFISLMLKGQVGPLTEEQKEYLAVANRNVARLASLIEKLLDFSRIEAGKVLRLQYRPSALSELIEDALMALAPQIEEKKISIENRIDPDTPPVMVDRKRITEVFINLIGNGIKFTPPGGKISIDSRGLSENREFLKIVVSDTGIGISPGDLPKIFDRFYQGKSIQGVAPKGTGLGLSITKEIIEGHRGTIHAESKEGSGTSFIFTVPLFGVNSIFNLIIYPMIEEAERDSIPLSLIQVGFWNQKTRREATFSAEAWDEVVGAIQKMVRSVDSVVPFQSSKIYIFTFNDKKLAIEIGKRVQGKLLYGSYIPKRTDIQIKTYSYPLEAPTKEDFIRGCRALLKEE